VASRIVDAAELVLAEPGAWVVSAAGFLARGGVLLFLAALLQLPSPITITLIFGVDSVTATGEPTARLLVTIGALIALAAAAIVAMLLTAAWADVVSIGRSGTTDASAAAEPEAPDSDTTVPTTRAPWATIADVLGVGWLQSLGLLPAVVAIALIAPTLRDVAVGEVLLPTSFSIPYLVRVVTDVAAPLARVLVILAVAELLVTVATRGYLATAGDRSTLRAYARALVEIARRPIAIAATWFVGLVALLVAVVFALWAISLAWSEARAVLLDVRLSVTAAQCDTASLCPPSIWGVPLDGVVEATSAAALFAVVWIGALGLIGIASAFRSTLWTLTIRSPARTSLGVASRADAHT
jgi:hypothetical protein